MFRYLTLKPGNTAIVLKKSNFGVKLEYNLALVFNIASTSAL